jgi:hypothetical protein
MSGGWFSILQAPADVDKTSPADGDVLVYDTTLNRWILKSYGVFGETDAVYLGDPLVDGTWRIVRDGNNLSFQRLEGGVWSEKGANLP